MGEKRKKVWDLLSEEERKELESYSQDYIAFLSTAKTERLASAEAENLARKAGYLPLEEAMKTGLHAGMKVYALNHEKGGAFFILGDDLEEGMDIVGSHLDCPRLDLKASPFWEDGNLCYMRTHYYGGIKKYQWPTIPLALHGVAFKKDGSRVAVDIGEKADEPVFFINDLLIHLARKQMKKTAAEVVEGEQLQIVVGSSSQGEGEKDEPVKSWILQLIQEKYGLDEDDFQMAELEAVPAGPAREVGFDRSLIAGHGHDDRVCSYANIRALLDARPASGRTKVALLVDKEEIGSVGNTGMHSYFFTNTVAEILNAMKGNYNELMLRRAMAHSRVLSADVCLSYDPNWPETVDKQNTAWTGCGVTINKYTGSGGKGGSNDANAEYLQQIRSIFDKEGVIWQTGELGAVDAGGGGTIAYILANLGAQVVDCGTGMLSMHAPTELLSKADAYETYRAYRAFYNA